MDRHFIWNRLAALLLVGGLGLAAGIAPAQSMRMVPETGHTAIVCSASFSPDGTRIVTGSQDDTAEVWDAASGKELLSLSGHAGSVFSASFSPDGTRIVTGSLDDTAKVWDAASGRELLSLNGHARGVLSASFSRNGARIVTGSEDDTAKVWDAASGKQLLSLEGNAGSITSASFSPDGTRIVTGSDDNTVKVWDVGSGKELRSWKGHTGGVFSASFSPDGTRIVTASNDTTAKVWDVASGKELRSLKGHSGAVNSAAFSPDGKRIVTGSWDGTAKVWDAASGKELLSLKGHAEGITSASFSPDGMRIVTASLDDTAKVWDATSGREVQILMGHASAVSSASFSPDGKRIVTAFDGKFDEKSAKVCDAASGKKLLGLKGHVSAFDIPSFSPDGTRTVTGPLDNTAKVWDAVSGKELLSLIGHASAVSSASFSPDGKRIVTGSLDDTAKVWDSSSGKELVSLKGHASWLNTASFSPDGTRIVTGSDDGTAKVWDAASGKKLASLIGHAYSVLSASFSRDGTRIVTGSEDDTAKVWDAANGKQLLSLEGNAGWITSASFSPDGMRIVTGSKDHTANVWDAVSGEELLSLEGHTGPVCSASFSPDGTQIITGSTDGSVRLWDSRSGKELYEIVDFADGSWIVVARDGRYDSSDGPRPHFGHFVMDLPGLMSEVVDFDQVRTKDYYEPDLVGKIMSGVYKPGEQPVFSQKPAPMVEESVEGDQVKLRVTARFGGGVGEIRVNVNGQEVRAFEKGQVASGVWTTWDGKGFVSPGASISVVADNALETLSSPRGESLKASAVPSTDPIRFVGVAMGVKDYLGSVAHLQYAGADAVAIARAMLTLAKSLGPTVRPELYLLTDEAVPDDLKGQVTVMPPNKASYASLVGKLKSGAKFTANTLLFLDFSGHGVMVGDKYVYLTKDARTADPEQLKNELSTGVTMDEILSFLNLDLAGKRLLVLDTCQAAGAEKVLAANLKQGEAELDAQKRTVADWQNRYAVGTQVLMGCPEGAASFEDPRYGHGLLTYSLLYCLRNNDLGDKPGDPEVWADRLVADTASQTQKFAEALGLKQDVQPLGAHHFPIGDMSKEARLKAIILPNPKPAIGACTLLDATDFPVESFNQAFIARLEGSARGSTVVHVASQQAPGVWMVTGRYIKSADGRVTMTLRLLQGEKRASLPELVTTEANAVEDAYKAISDWLAVNAKP